MFVILVVGMEFYTRRKIKRIIGAEVEKAGARNLSIKFVLINEDGLAGTYDVRYYGADGLYHVRNCLVRMTYSGIRIYWLNEELL